MSDGPTRGERIWRAIALGLLIALAWQMGNVALAPRSLPDMAAVVAERHEPEPPAHLLTPEPPPSPAAADLQKEPAPEPAPAPVAAPVSLRVTNTGGAGVYLRATPRMADRLHAWPDGTVMLPTGEEAEAEGRRWLQVRDPAGMLGWIPAQFLN
jgi:hypothetical protein